MLEKKKLPTLKRGERAVFFSTRSRTGSTIAMETGGVCVEEEAGLVSVTGLYPLSYGNIPQRDL